MSTVSDVHKDQTWDGVSVDQPTCDIIYDEYVWDSISKQESAYKLMFLVVHLSHITLTSSMILLHLLNLSKNWFLMMLIPIILKTYGMLVLHLNMEWKNLLFLIFQIHHLIISKKQRMNFLISNLALFLIH